MSYYTAPGTPTIRGRLSSEQIRDQWSALERAFAQLPLPLSDGGNTGFSNGRWEGGAIINATISGSTVGTQIAPSIGHFSALYMVGSDYQPTPVGTRAWVADTLGQIGFALPT